MRLARPLLVDERRARAIFDDLLRRRPGYLPQWLPRSRTPGTALGRIFARYLEIVLERLNQAPEKNKLAFLDLLGVRLIPARAARAPVVFRLREGAPASRLPAGAQVASPPPPEESEQIVFEVEHAMGLSGAQLKEVVSLWPGRDQYIDHSEDLVAGELIRPWRRQELENTPHVLYLAHDVLLALSGKTRLDVEFEVAQASSEKLRLLWEYWDGQVWRGFKQQHPECPDTDQKGLESTAGLTKSGKYQLETECAETARREIDGVESYWVRALLDETLPLDPDRILPEVSQVRIKTVVEQPLKIFLTSLKDEYKPPEAAAPSESIDLEVVDGDGTPLEGVQVDLFRPDDGTLIAREFTGVDGKIAQVAPPYQGEYRLVVGYLGLDFERPVLYQPPDTSTGALSLKATLQILGLKPDSAFADADPIDATKPFFPLGQMPRPGSVFYFRCEEIFTKPGAQMTLHLKKAETPQDAVGDSHTGAADSGTTRTLEHQLVWEYWNGRFWSPLLTFNDVGEDPKAFTADGDIDITIPADIAPTTVNEEEALWMRTRLVSGAYGFTTRASWKDTTTTDSPEHTFTFFIPRPPALADFRISYVWEHGPYHPDHVRTYNDFRYEDRTRAARWPGELFPPFQQVADLTPALYLGFDQSLPVDRLNLYADIVEQPQVSPAPELEWEYWNGASWRQVAVEDGTRDLLYPEMVSWIGPADAESYARFGTERHWLRARLKRDGLPPGVELRGLHPHAAWVSQRQTIRDENVGVSNGQPRQRFSIRRFPVLDGERLEVREVDGARAAVEWRIKANELFGDDPARLRRIESRLAAEGTKRDIIEGDLRLHRDRDKKVTEVWVRWHAQPHFLSSSDEDRHYVLERARGVLHFGDGEAGRIPPLGATIAAMEYRTGGGRRGNVAKDAISEFLAGAAGVESVFNPRAAEVGADGEDPATFALRAPRSLRARGRALLPADFETMAHEASSAVAVARALPARDPHGRAHPGWVTLVVLPHGDEARPWPSFGLRETVRRYIEERTAATIAGARRVHVTGPEYREVGVSVTIAPVDITAAGRVESEVRRTVERFLHPLRGGPEGKGWTPGRDVFLSDVAAEIERVEDVDYVRDLELLLEGVPQGEQVRVPDGETVLAGPARIQVVM